MHMDQYHAVFMLPTSLKIPTPVVFTLKTLVFYSINLITKSPSLVTVLVMTGKNTGLVATHGDLTGVITASSTWICIRIISE